MKFSAISLLFIATATIATADKLTSSEFKRRVPHMEDPKTTNRSLKVKSPSAAKAHRITKSVAFGKKCSDQNQVVKTVYQELEYDMTSFPEDVCSNGSNDGITCEENEVTQIFVSSHSLTGTISSLIGCLSKLAVLVIYNNNLGGSIPTELAELTSLRLLDLNGNELGGSIPTELAELPHLEHLFLHGNELGGSIPTELAQLPSIYGLSLYGNELGGSIPTALAELTSLGYLYLHGNKLGGTIPTELCDLSMQDGLFLVADDDMCRGSCGPNECCDCI